MGIDNKRKYTIYIKDFSEWITDFNFEYQMSDGYCFQTRQWDLEKNDYVKPLKLNIEEAIWCIVDCTLNNYRFKIYNEDEFLVEYNKYKNDDKNCKQFEWWKSWLGDVEIDFDNILEFKKKVYEVEFVSINRNNFVHWDTEVEINTLYTYYNLTTNQFKPDIQPQYKLHNILEANRKDYKYEFERRYKFFYSSLPIVSFKEENGYYVFETLRSIFKTKKIIENVNVDTKNELKEYLESDAFDKFINQWGIEEMRYSNIK